MLRIAVCDDEKTMVQSNTATLEAALKELGITGEITTYTNSRNLLYDITEDGFHYDLLLSDIEMPELSGMELAEKIKPFLPDIRIIFITSHIEYAIDAFELSIFRYVPKSDIAKRLPTAIKDAVSLINLEADKSYTIQVKGRFEKNRSGISCISSVTVKMPPSIQPTECQRSAKACRQFLTSLIRKSSYSSTEDIS